MVKFNLKKLRNSEFLNYVSRLLEIIKSTDSLKMQLGNFINRLTSVFSLLTIAFNKLSTNLYTIEVEDKDALRDRAYLAFRDYVEVCTKRLNVNWNADAYLILDIIRSNSWNLHKENYDLQSGSLSKLFISLEKSEVVAAINNIQAAEWLQELKIAENSFVNSIQSRNQHVVSGTELIESKNARADAFQLVSDTLNYIDVLKRMSPSSELSVLELRINELNKEFANRISIREGRKHATNVNS